MLTELCNIVFNIEDDTFRQEISNQPEPEESLTLNKKHKEPMSSYLSMTNLWFVSFEEQGPLAFCDDNING
jgi:hypothetical protein